MKKSGGRGADRRPSRRGGICKVNGQNGLRAKSVLARRAPSWPVGQEVLANSVMGFLNKWWGRMNIRLWDWRGRRWAGDFGRVKG